MTLDWTPVARGLLAVHTVGSSDMAAQLAQDISHRLAAAIVSRGDAVLCVSGGKSPMALFEALRVQSIDWSRVRVTLTDERCVPCTHPDSNAGLVRQYLLKDHASMAQLVPMVVETGMPLPSPPLLARAASAALQAAGVADVLVLGMGVDGHMASLFPGAANLDDALDLNNPQTCVAIELAHPPANAPYARVTQTLAQILSARHIVLPLSGADKLSTLRQAWAGINNQHPISHVLHQTRTPVGLWLSL
jgi:6-phosphogluconolactonase